MCTNFSYDSIKKALDEQITELKKVDPTNAMSIFLAPEVKEEKKETDAERIKRIGVPADNIEELLKEYKCEEAIPLLKEHDIDNEQFWGLGDGDLKELLKIEIFGRRKKLTLRIERIKKAHEKKMEELKK